MKILSIGNSFSQDAHKWLQKLAKLNGVDLEAVNLYIGSCSLKAHWDNASAGLSNYDLEYNGEPATRKISIAEALELDQWDIVTVQQVSGWSGVWESFEPYLPLLVQMVRKMQPNAKLYFHQTWAYESDSTHNAFSNYNHDQNEMYRCIEQVSELAAQSVNVKLLPVGTVIQSLRKNIPEFDYQNGGCSLCRDGFHLSLDYGRFAAAATWLHTITGIRVSAPTFEDFDPEILKKILDVVNNV